MSFERLTRESSETEPAPSNGLGSIREATRGNEDLEELYDIVERGVHDYYRRTLAFRSTTKDTPNKLVERYDHDKRITHDALLSSLTALARNMKAQGKPTPWWNGAGGFCKGRFVDRHIVASWAVREATEYLQQELQTRE